MYKVLIIEDDPMIGDIGSPDSFDDCSGANRGNNLFGV
ncbi:response regulator of citrate/malate metabolism [Paenibacillus aceris]|uniref:Response regulator of citrate/malate metabolism n=1 Tax=Paenibacillus aceris TaxID=869555 RepID=A0ABS4HV43_9BACL|nr:response regulator of citrate/malate metabolism [Paenibacillus aceris]